REDAETTVARRRIGRTRMSSYFTGLVESTPIRSSSRFERALCRRGPHHPGPLLPASHPPAGRRGRLVRIAFLAFSVSPLSRRAGVRLGERGWGSEGPTARTTPQPSTTAASASASALGYHLLHAPHRRHLERQRHPRAAGAVSRMAG